MTIANYNCPGQIVITGVTAGVEQAAEELKTAGAKRLVMLNVSGPFHSPLLKPAGEELLKELPRVQKGRKYAERLQGSIPGKENHSMKWMRDILNQQLIC